MDPGGAGGATVPALCSAARVKFGTGGAVGGDNRHKGFCLPRPSPPLVPSASEFWLCLRGEYEAGPKRQGRECSFSKRGHSTAKRAVLPRQQDHLHASTHACHRWLVVNWPEVST
ncbi:hypothetical protein AAFF_G00244720 [Aldrovandia affinis]|uniref:Uncharacterized protein n=1 Tax=Aldrovandia affinis TaxID=143900 RepID=A0AAD7RDS7_9TELE|nr:hypothetical protein AAFF_G00244720 [Aldrovandia affinis]